jgi:hypothetical protein
MWVYIEVDRVIVGLCLVSKGGMARYTLLALGLSRWRTDSI